jgi:hypothetical protein
MLEKVWKVAVIVLLFWNLLATHDAQKFALNAAQEACFSGQFADQEPGGAHDLHCEFWEAKRHYAF